MRCSTHLQPHLISLLSLLISTLLWDWRRTASSKFFDTQASSVSTEELVRPRDARCVLYRLHCNGHIFLFNFYLSRVKRIENFSCSGHPTHDTPHLILHCPAADVLRCLLFGDSFSTSGQGFGELLGFLGSTVSRLIPISWKWSDSNNN